MTQEFTRLQILEVIIILCVQRLRKAPKVKVECRVKYNTAKLKNEQVLKAFNITLSNRYQP